MILIAIVKCEVCELEFEGVFANRAICQCPGCKAEVRLKGKGTAEEMSFPGGLSGASGRTEEPWNPEEKNEILRVERSSTTQIDTARKESE